MSINNICSLHIFNLSRPFIKSPSRLHSYLQTEFSFFRDLHRFPLNVDIKSDHRSLVEGHTRIKSVTIFEYTKDTGNQVGEIEGEVLC
jgi:hypothetical protein